MSWASAVRMGISAAVLAAFSVRVSWTPAPSQPSQIDHPLQMVAHVARELSRPTPPRPTDTVAPSQPATPVVEAEVSGQPIDLAGHLRLLGTAVLEEPVAWIENRNHSTTGRYRQGEPLFEDVRVTFIGSGMVWLERHGVLTQLRLEASVEEGTLPYAPSQPTVAVPSGDQEPLRLRAEYTHQGIFQGLVIASVGPEGPWGGLGLRAGDRLVAINGQPLSSPQQTLQLMRKAVAQPSVSVWLERDGQLLTLRWATS